MYPQHVSEAFVQVAIDWHGGQSSALYSVSSTGCIYDQGYKDLLESELRRIDDPAAKEFLQWVESLPDEELVEW